ncbi:hypothetical protein WAI453_013050 [Rhynchosporium graminicola]
MTSSKQDWYTPKNTTHKILFIVLPTFALIGLLIALLRTQIHSSLTSICHTLSPAPSSTFLTPFETNFTYQSIHPKTDDLWNDLVTPNGGFIYEGSGDEKRVYGVGMFHQLHCLQIFRNHLQELYSKKQDRSNRRGMKRGVVHGHHLDLHHTLHCMDYFRQVFLCFADDSLEAATPGTNGERPNVDGMVPHQCRDPSGLYARSLKSGTRTESKAKDHTAHGHAR